MSLRVVHVLDHSVPLHSGYAFRTLSILREQHKLGWETLQVTTPKQGRSKAREEAIDGFTFLRSGDRADPGLVRQMRLTAARVRQAVERFQPDLIHAHSPLLTAVPSLTVARRHRLPLVYEVRATWEDAAVDHGTTTEGSPRYRLSRWLETIVLRQADHVTTICEGLQAEIASRKIDPSKITVIPNAVDIERFSYHGGADSEAKKRLGLRDVGTIGFVGSFYGYEGLDDLVDAMALLRDRDAGVQLILVGGGPEDANLRAQVERTGLQGHVRFIGRVSHDEVQTYYRAIDVLVYPRKRTRLTDLVTPLKPLESMAQGNVVLASDVGGHRELIRNGETGVLFPAGDVRALAEAIERILAEQPTWEAMRSAGLGFVTQERNWERSVCGYRRAYGRALAARGRTAGFLEDGE